MTENKPLKNHDTPHPVDSCYQWPGDFAPMATQRETMRFLTAHARAYCLNELGTGKTLASLWAFDFLRERGQAKRLLVVAPLSTRERTWGDEIFRHFPHLLFVILHGTAERRRMLLRNPSADVFIIDHNGVKDINEALDAMTDIDTVIIDELAQVARYAPTDRWKALRALSEKRERIWGLTSNPTPNAPTDAWAQCRLLTPSTVPTYFAEFRDMTMRQTANYSWATGEDAVDIVHQAMQPSIRFKREDCTDLPPVMYETREVPLSKDQQEAYDSTISQIYAEYQGGQITAVNEAVKAMKLVQIGCGSADGDDGNTVVNPPKARINALLDIIEEAPSKVVVFVPFKAALWALHDEVSKYHAAEMIYGEVPRSVQDRILGNFQKSSHPRVLITQPATMSDGLTLTAATVIVWYAPITSAETYEQANGRNTRPSQQHNQLIMHIQSSRLEARGCHQSSLYGNIAAYPN